MLLRILEVESYLDAKKSLVLKQISAERLGTVEWTITKDFGYGFYLTCTDRTNAQLKLVEGLYKKTTLIFPFCEYKFGIILTF